MIEEVPDKKSTRDLVVETHTIVQEIREQLSDKEKRIRRLEKQNYIAYGLIAALMLFKEKLTKLLTGS